MTKLCTLCLRGAYAEKREKIGGVGILASPSARKYGARLRLAQARKVVMMNQCTKKIYRESDFHC